MNNPSIIGYVISVTGFMLKIDVASDVHSPIRATPDSVKQAVAINTYLSFDLGAGAYAVGILTSLENREAFSQSTKTSARLKLTTQNKTATVMLLGTVQKTSDSLWRFDPGITAFPSLDTPAEIANSDILHSIFVNIPNFSGSVELTANTVIDNPNSSGASEPLRQFQADYPLQVGTLAGDNTTIVSASFNDLFSRPFAIVGNTGSGKSCTVAKLLLEIIDHADLKHDFYDPHIFILDINGEYTKVFRKDHSSNNSNGESKCEHISEPNKIYLDGEEFCLPVWLMNGEEICAWLQAAEATQQPALKAWWAKAKHSSANQHSSPNNTFAANMDAPHSIKLNELKTYNFVPEEFRGDSSLVRYLTTMNLRMQSRLDDKRWESFWSYEEQGINSFHDWLDKIGIGKRKKSRVSVFDLSMLSSETLPYTCAILGRLLLELRELQNPAARDAHPWVLVLEEAHNYVKPRRTEEEQSFRLSRQSFERIAKEGRKFGLSLIIASQRPNEISPTIVSQCANFFSHRLQNPDDIEHIRRIVPEQAQRLLDQVTILSAGEAILFGSAVNTPARVQIAQPSPKPFSSSAKPFSDWSSNSTFPIDDVLSRWGILNHNTAENPTDNGIANTNQNESQNSEDDVPW